MIRAEAEKRAIAKAFQARINNMQGLSAPACVYRPDGLGLFSDVFYTGVIHEFISYQPEYAACTSGFIAALSAKITKQDDLFLWIGSEKRIFPSQLKHFGLEPDRIVFIDADNYKDTLWIIEEALKCEALTTVIAEIAELGFTESRRLQLAAERSGVTGIIHRYQPRTESATACTTRWKVTPLPGISPDGLPGVGYSAWDIQLLKVKNGRPRSWQVSWQGNTFHQLNEESLAIHKPQRHAI